MIIFNKTDYFCYFFVQQLFMVIFAKLLQVQNPCFVSNQNRGSVSEKKLKTCKTEITDIKFLSHCQWPDSGHFLAPSATRKSNTKS
jgi:hypothetical protein